MRDDLEDHLAQPEEALAERAVVGVDLAHAATLDPEGLEGLRRALEVRRQHHQMVNMRHAVPVLGICGDRFGGRRGGQAVDLLAAAGVRRPAEDSPARGEVELHGADPGGLGPNGESGARPGGRVGPDGDPPNAHAYDQYMLPAQLRLGPVHLTVRDLDRAVAWYERSLGLRLHGREGEEAELGDGAEPVVVLHEDAEASSAGRHAGLYHYALLYPSREELAREALRLIETQTPIQGMSDHGTHEAIYLPDADGNGIELAADRDLAEWPSFEEEIARGGPQPLDLNALLATVGNETPPAQAGEGLRVGHVHLHVGDVDEGLAFYRDAIGFDERANIGSAAFVSAGGYHHHLGFNTWRGEGVAPPPPHTVGLRHWTVVLPSADDVSAVRSGLQDAGVEVEALETGFRVRDPWGTAVAILAPA
jgi:catechol 2,3-dioxygenase